MESVQLVNVWPVAWLFFVQPETAPQLDVSATLPPVG
jgi:hypothetical protein